MPNPFRDDTQFPKRITLPTISGSARAFNPTPGGIYGTDNPFLGVGGASGLPTAAYPFGGTGAQVGYRDPRLAQTGANNVYGIAGKTGNGNPSGLGVSGSIGSPFTRTGTGNGVSQPNNVRFEYAKRRLDPTLGEGWTDEFTKRHGVDPITMFVKNFPKLENNPEAQVGAALRYAEDYGRFIPRAVEEWKKVHGDTEIPPEQWDSWHYQIMRGGNAEYGGAGVNPFQVY